MDPTARTTRPAVSCKQCRKRKIKCDRSTPCSNCTKSSPGQDCDYTNVHHPQASPAQPSSVNSNARMDADNESHATLCDGRSGIGTPAAPNPPVRSSTPAFPVTKTSLPGVSDAFYAQYDYDQYHEQDPDTADPSAQRIPRLVSHKTRVFGQSHWISPCITLYGKEMIGIMAKTIPPQAFADLQRCKTLARLIKSRRSPAWPTPLTRDLPSQNVADILAERYFDTSETYYRVLHSPMFYKYYIQIWDPEDEEPSVDFLIQAKLVMAIGATTYDDEFSLRSSAVRWIQEAMTWNSSPNDFKARLTIQGLQNGILIILAQSLVGVGRDMVWPAAASLLRCAMHMGLHRDPSKLKPASDIHTTELRRRLWNTILEITTQTSLDVGGAPLLSITDFDTLPPSNFHDYEIYPHLPATLQREPHPLSKFTESTIAAVFRQTLPARLAIVHFLNGLPAPSPSTLYSTTLALDSALRAAYTSLTSTLRPFSREPPFFSILHLELLIHRYLAALHVPFLATALLPSPDPSPFLYSRTMALSSALRIWSTSASSSVPLFTRFASNGASFLRASSVQAVFVVAAELRAQLLAERASLVPAGVRPDLMGVVREAEEWALKCVKGGETNVKGYLFVCMVRAQLEALGRGVVEEREVAEVLGRTAQEAGGRCVGILEGMLGALGGGAGDDGGLGAEAEVTGGGFEMSDFLFGFESAEAINWEF
ncbi:hypothetical protein QBC39DRAFT_408945 [Podospora conica]|nr:hypothetical protein QBC39DRAFT_408945 [Schizothecium conicum]